ncbi:MAG: CpaF family protein [Alphaproteobacteria bacterium]|nr:CpaF family protein [Alphaproteobacteria bacterium]
MFGKKQSGSSEKSAPAKKAASAAQESEEKKKKSEEKKSTKTPAEAVAKPKEEKKKDAAVAVKADDDAGNILEGIDEALDTGKEEKKPAFDLKGEGSSDNKKAANKPLKDMDDGILKGVEEEEEEEISATDSISDLRLQRCRNRIWLDLRDGIDLKALARMDAKAAREEVYSAVEEISRFRNLDLTPTELQKIAKECADDMLGFGPLEELLERDDIADIMINGPETTYIEVGGKIERTKINFRDNQHLVTICQRIVGAIGRRVDEASPICDARLADGSRVNVIIPPLAVDGACMTIRKFKKDKLTLEKLLEFGSMSPSCAKLIMAIGRCRVNVLVSGGTGSGKTTMLNCLTRYIEAGERVITCEDACELQLQQPHVVRLETRPPNLEGVGEITMRDLVKNCLRMRPERIIVGEVRGPEAFDLLQAMNTGHDGSMGTVHANNPREAISRMENMIAMGGLNLPQKAVREQIASAVNVIIQVQRLRDGSRKTTHVSEITGMEGEVVTMQDLFSLDIEGEDENGKLITKQKSSGLRPKFFDNARQYGVADMVMNAMEEAYG